MDISEAIKNMGCSKKYKDIDIKKEDIIEILNISQNSPFIKDARNYYFIIVSDKDKISNISSSIGIESLKNAKILVVLCYDFKLIRSYYNEGYEKYVYGSFGEIVQNILLLLKEKGLEGCVVWDFNEQSIKGILKVPQDINIISIIYVGVPDDKSKPFEKRNIQEIIFFDEWGNKSYKPDFYPLSENFKKIVSFFKS